MKLIFYKDLKKRKIFQKFETRRILSKSILGNLLLPIFCRRYFFFLFIFTYPKYSNFSAYRNRCFMTNSARSIRSMGCIALSRQQLFKNFSESSFFPVKKASDY